MLKKNIIPINKILFPIIFLLGFSCAQAQNTEELDRVVKELNQEEALKHAHLSLNVYNISSQKNIYSYNADHSMTPASLVKIFTTAIGFEQMGSDFRFKTTIGYTGEIDKTGILHGNLYIIGGGDPMLGSYRFRQTMVDTLFKTWFQAIQGQGIRGIDGRICFDATIFDDQPLHDSWQWGDVGNYYGSGVRGLNFHENMYFIYFNPGKKLGYPATISYTTPKNLNVRNQNEVVTGPEGSGDNVIIYGSPNNPGRLYRGTVPLGKNNFPIKGSLPNPGETCAELFAVYLRSHDMNVTNSVSEVFSKTDSVKTILDYFSNTYYIIAQYTNLTSNNMYAESIFKFLGYTKYGKGTFNNGAKVLVDYFKTNNLESSGVKVVDGCGLSRLNRVTSDFVCRFLISVNKKPYYEDFVNTLGKVGENGTVKNLLPDLSNKVTMRVKSGSMDGVRAYAGYVVTPKGETLCFSLIANDFTCSAAQMKGKMEKILYKIGELN